MKPVKPVKALADARRVNVAALARSVLLLVPEEVVRAIPDPGGPQELFLVFKSEESGTFVELDWIEFVANEK